MQRKKEEIVEVEDLFFHFETIEYYCVSTEEDTFGDEAERIFLSKTYVEKDVDVFIMPKWYALQKGLI